MKKRKEGCPQIAQITGQEVEVVAGAKMRAVLDRAQARFLHTGGPGRGFGEEIMSLVNKRHGGGITAGIGMELAGHDTAAGSEGEVIHLIIQIEKMPVGLSLVACAHELYFSEECGGKSFDTAFKTEAVDFLAQVSAGDVTGDKKENIAQIKRAELTESFKCPADAGVVKPENAGVFTNRTPGDFELEMVNRYLREDLGEVHDDHRVSGNRRHAGCLVDQAPKVNRNCEVKSNSSDMWRAAGTSGFARPRTIRRIVPVNANTPPCNSGTVNNFPARVAPRPPVSNAYLFTSDWESHPVSDAYLFTSDRESPPVSNAYLFTSDRESDPVSNAYLFTADRESDPVSNAYLFTSDRESHPVSNAYLFASDRESPLVSNAYLFTSDRESRSLQTSPAATG
ncbi:MAG: hypothetical protein WCN95_11795 [bacterium]